MEPQIILSPCAGDPGLSQLFPCRSVSPGDSLLPLQLEDEKGSFFPFTCLMTSSFSGRDFGKFIANEVWPLIQRMSRVYPVSRCLEAAERVVCGSDWQEDEVQWN